MNYVDVIIYTDLLQPYVRMTQRSMFVNKYAKLYLSSKANLRELLAFELKDKARFKSVKKVKVGGQRVEVNSTYVIPVKTAFTVEASVVYPKGKLKRKQDLDNILKALLDAGNELIYEDDRWCDSVNIKRLEIDNNMDVIMVWMAFTWK